jgi:G3E family GTPase
MNSLSNQPRDPSSGGAGAKARYVMVGGFLGAWLTARGLRVGLITNDQGGGLVDTTLAEAADTPVEEIVGGCFCCRFNSLVEAADALSRETAPDVLLAEPVGSCTDLVATVSLPLEQIYGDRFTVAPLSVVLDPVRAARVLGLADGRRLSENVEYIYCKQLEEAELVVVNKIDLVDATARAALRRAIATVAPRAKVYELSAREGIDVEPWFEATLTGLSQATSIAEIDYDRYALGESLLGWLNAEIRVTATTATGEFDGNAFLTRIMIAMREALAAEAYEIAHLKATLCLAGDPYELAAANLVRTEDEPRLSHRLAESIDAGRLQVNLRAEAAPEQLERALAHAMDRLADTAVCEIQHLEHFRPGRPVPTHRLASTPEA